MNAPQSALGKGMTPATKGILLMVLAMFFISVMGVATKTAGISHPIMQVVFVRNFFVLALVLVMVWRKGGTASLKVNDRKGVGLRAFFQFGSATFIATTVILLPLADAEALFFAAPLIIAFLSLHFLGERVGWRRKTAIFVGFIGVIVMLRPTPDLIQPVALFGVVASVFIALRDIWTRKLREGETANAIMFWSDCRLAALRSLCLAAAHPPRPRHHRVRGYCLGCRTVHDGGRLPHRRGSHRGPLSLYRDLVDNLVRVSFLRRHPGRICYWRRSHRDREWPLHLTA